jgi:shikimate dehydrogenase
VLSGRTTLVGLLGDPIAGSLSPRLQNAAFAALALDWAYVPLPVTTGRLAAAIEGLRAVGFAGANVTIPHKRAAAALCDELDPGAERAGSVNTLVFTGGRIVGGSTDAAALGQLAPGRAAVVGAGGAAAAWIDALEQRGAEVRVFSRSGTWPPETADAELVVHATPVADGLLFEPRPEQAIVDLAYRADGEPTVLAAAARAAGCTTVVDGLDVLVRQGAASFERWTGVAAPVDVMRAAVDLRA